MSTLDDDYTQLLTALLPRGMAWEGGNPLIEGLAPSLSRVHTRTTALMREISPGDSAELIDRYEALCGLPDKCIPVGVQTLTQRRRRLAAKINGYGGINEAFYLNQLRLLGYDGVIITQFQNNDPDAPDTWPADATLDDYRYYWRVNMPDSAETTVMTCGDSCNSALRVWGDAVAECVIDKLCPSHTVVLFSYAESDSKALKDKEHA